MTEDGRVTDPYSQQSRIDGNGMYNPGFTPSVDESDVIVTRPMSYPITNQPAITSSLSSMGAWTYTPTGAVPLQRPDFYGSVSNMSISTTTDINRTSSVDNLSSPYKQSEVPTLRQLESRNSISSSVIQSHPGSRDWSRDLFDAFRDKHSAPRKGKFAKIKTFFWECFRVPCMLCEVSRSLGDKAYLPYIPGTGAAIRFKVRILGGIQGTIGNDCLVMTCCCPCAVCQMYREIEDIGLGPT